MEMNECNFCHYEAIQDWLPYDPDTREKMIDKRIFFCEYHVYMFDEMEKIDGVHIVKE
jgi:hypothetical protein